MKQPEARRKEVIEVAPNQQITIIEYTESYFVQLRASKNPLDRGQCLWFYTFIKERFGKEAADSAKVVDLDLNQNINMTFSANQITLGQISGMCLAAYGKGDMTRMEIRNFNPNIPLLDFIDAVRFTRT